MKRGVSMFPFLLIFVLIAGAIILMFFFKFGTDLGTTSGKVNDLTILKNLDQQLAAFSLATNAYNHKIEFGLKSEIEVSCSDTKTSLTLNKNTLKSQKLIVSPIVMKGKSLQAWTLSWDYPFKIDNFYYLIPSQGESRSVNIFIKTPSTLNQENKKFINSFRFRAPPIDSPLDVGGPTVDKKIVFILENEANPQSNPQSYSAPNTNVVQIDFDNSDWGTRTVKICRDGGACLTEKYYGNPLAIALAFSSSNENYECIRDQAFIRAKNVIELYQGKLALLVAKTPSDCLYQNEAGTTTIANYLDDLHQIALNPASATPELLSKPPKLENANKYLKITKCPELYVQ